MTWFVTTGWDMPQIKRYEDARAIWEKVQPLRGSQTPDVRPIGRRLSANARKVIRKANGDILFTLHGTDVVTWHTDQTVTLHGYPRFTRDSFVYRVLPRGFRYDATARVVIGPGNYWERTCGRYSRSTKTLVYSAAKPVRFVEHRGTWAVTNVDELAPLVLKTLDHDKARQVRESSGYNEFSAWCRMVRAMDAVSDRGYVRYTVDDVLSALAQRDVSKYPDILKWLGLAPCIHDAVMRGLRTRIYKDSGCVIETAVQSCNLRQFYNQCWNSRY